MKHVLREASLIAVVGIAVGFTANALSPRGIRLNADPFHLRDPFHSVETGPPAATNGPPTNPGTNALAAAESIEAKVKAAGLQLVVSNQVVQWFNDPRREANLIVFVDARSPEAYAQGHIPGAFEFYDAAPQDHLDTVPFCLGAQQVVVYCNGGGECDESINAALTLRDMKVPVSNLFVYGGGIAEWSTNGLPLEAGQRLSGQPPGKPK